MVTCWRSYFESIVLAPEEQYVSRKGIKKNVMKPCRGDIFFLTGLPAGRYAAPMELVFYKKSSPTNISPL